MKRLFFLLLVANLLVYLGARVFFPSYEPDTDVRGGGDIRFLSLNELKILRAIAQEAEARLPAPAEAMEEPPEPPQELKQEEPVMDDPAVAETAPEPKESLTEPAKKETPGAGAKDDDLKLKVLEDLKLGDVECVALGPLDAEPDAKALAHLLANQNMAGVVRWVDASQPQSFWVVLYADSDSEAANLMKKLRDAGQGDLWWISDGDLKGDVSVGVFRNRENAEVRRKQIQAIGLEADVVARKSERKLYWIDLRADASRRVDLPLLQKLRKKYPDLTVEPRRCPSSPL